MTFTITQTADTSNLYIYPTSSSVTQCISSGSANHNMIDEVWHSPDDDAEYVYTTNIGSQYDYYNTTNHTTETGNINYVKVVTRVKSNIYDQNSSGTYKIWIKDNLGSTVSSSNLAPITATYKQYSNMFSSSPSGAAWDWNAVDNLLIGFECSSPTLNASTNYFRIDPINAGSANTLGGTWETVSDSNDATYIQCTAGTGYALFDGTAHTTQTAPIDDITFYRRIKLAGVGDSKSYLRLLIGGSDRVWDIQGATTAWADYSVATATNPDTGAAWTWSNVDDLEFGVHMVYDLVAIYCSEVWGIVQYSVASANPEIRTTQCYAIVNYSPSASTVTLNTPESLSVSHGRNIERFSFAQGGYEIIDTGRASKTLQISGTEVTDADTKMQGIRDQMHYGSVVSIAGLPDTNLNTDYYITGFSCEDISYGSVIKYHWSITLEQA